MAVIVRKDRKHLYRTEADETWLEASSRSNENVKYSDKGRFVKIPGPTSYFLEELRYLFEMPGWYAVNQLNPSLFQRCPSASLRFATV